MTATDQTGRILAGRYRLEALLGNGSSAQVWRAFDLRLSRMVAVKLLHPGLAADEGFLRRFRAEAQIVAQLNHRHLLRVFDWGEEPDGQYLVGEYLAGGSLRDLYDRGVKLSIAQVVAIGIGCAHGLAYAHRRGLVHRDVKPANLLFDEEGEVRIADFGLARALAEAAWTEPAGTVLGTARYASPEQAEGRPLDGRSDVYSLALVLYEALTGQVPFAQDTTLATLQARIGQRLPPSRALGAIYPILAEASIADPLARLEAAELAVELELLASILPRPEPLPIEHVSPPVSAKPAPAAPVAPERTPDPPPPPVGALPDDTLVGSARPTTSAFFFDQSPEEQSEEETGPDDTFVGAPARGGAPSPTPRRARRGRKRLLVALVVVLLLAAGGVAADRLLLARETVPNVAGATLTKANSAIDAVGLTLHQGQRAYSLSVPVGDVVSESPKAGSKLAKGAAVTVVLSSGPAPVALPKLVGVTLRNAESMLGGLHLHHRVRTAYEEQVPNGVVVTMSPASGSVPYESVVDLVVSRGPAPRTIPAGLVGASWSSVQSTINALRLVASEHLAYSSSVASGTVISTSPASGTGGVAVGSTVVVTVSKGPDYVTVPSVGGDSIQSAVSRLQGLGLDVTEVIGPPFATTAVTTNPSAGQSVVVGSSIVIYAS